MVLILALVHALPVVLVAVVFRNSMAVNVAAGVMLGVAVVLGGPQYMFPDVLAVGGAWFFSRWFVKEGNQRPRIDLIERELEAHDDPRLPGPMPKLSNPPFRDKALPTSDPRDPDDYYVMGLHCENGDHGVRDLARAAVCYEAAAFAGHAMAQYRLGLMFASGEGVLKDDVQGYAWLDLAAGQGLEIARTAATGLYRRMDAGQAAAARSTSREIGARIDSAS